MDAPRQIIPSYVAGANIRELNCLRKQISVLKGGGLAEVAYPCRIISLVLSDIVGDPLDFIASGPTIPNTDSPESAPQILKKYHLYEEIPDSIRRVLQKENQFSETAAPVINGEYAHVKNYIIGKKSKNINDLLSYMQSVLLQIPEQICMLDNIIF